MSGQTDFRSQGIPPGKSQEEFTLLASFLAISTNLLASAAGPIDPFPFYDQHLDVLRSADGGGCLVAGIPQAGAAVCRTPLSGCNPKLGANSRLLTAVAGEYLRSAVTGYAQPPFMHSSPAPGIPFDS
jgi:hypothetical protein